MSVFVVTISEQFPYHGNETEIAVFSAIEKAEAWIEEQISLIVKRENLPADSVDGWFVEIGDRCHTLQYDVHEREVL